ncbi:4-(cytidine 5'-diphospho)-2-C-methyl-D-erythritol kinase [Oscillibacter hominis]|uniref:4-diphosphocytidyl-2-C-methyl-D-erythritol kinase n=1 Tax=Oscillibacter hominis TaxID=2763056 RepID=A0A7G9B7D1_9FIRM|nr:4-(cytidine 5'-diphospho)-2-C-methyl-D-erythritol kinase [Oscillibacter hominis]QNL45462.1 4-(cytidine 5'-diphospho)-2-C-methyl-D-erythritol kinase [Oscillibacter hominis]
MITMTYSAPAKINLSLDILRKRKDGFHDMRMVMQTITLHDTLILHPHCGGGRITLSCGGAQVPCGEENLAWKAAQLFFEETDTPCDGLEMELRKRIPVSAGMAGGSADAAVVLKALRGLYRPSLPREELERIALKVGSDVPFCVRGGTVLAEGRGEQMTSLARMPRCPVVLCKPGFGISTPELFGRVTVSRLKTHPDTRGLVKAIALGDLRMAAGKLGNVFEEVLPQEYGEVFEIRDRLLGAGALNAGMTGSGPTVFALFDDETRAKGAYEALAKDYSETYLEKIL